MGLRFFVEVRMKFYGYDPKIKCLFSWNGDFSYEGKTDVAPEGSFLVEEVNREWLEVAGCSFLSGSRADGYSFRIKSFDEDVTLIAGSILANRISVTDQHPWESVVKWVSRKDSLISLCGSVVSDPIGVAKFCRQFPTMRTYVCPLVDELAAFGVLAMKLVEMKKERPRRAFLCSPNEDMMNADSVEFDSKLQGDGYGVMANVVAHGVPILNEMMICPGVSPFYGRVLLRNFVPNAAYLVRCEVMMDYFPYEPVSAKMYAATSVPVEFVNNEAFRKISGCTSERVNIVVVSDYIPMLPVFMNFYKIMSGLDFVASFALGDMPSSESLSVFRTSRAYRVKNVNAC